MAGPRELTEAALAACRVQGFHPAGVCAADPPESLRQFKDWLDKGCHGTMSYLERSLPLRADPQTVLPGARSVIMVGLNYNQPNPVVPGRPRIAKYALGRDYHKVVRAKLRRVANTLMPLLPGATFRVCVDSAPLLEREYANRAGLGWFGKNTCLIDSRTGSFFVLGALITTAELAPTPRASGGCGTCRLCVDACPTGAIVKEDGRWQVDSPRCISYLTIEHKGPIEGDTRRIGDWTFGCDVCQDVCPFNQQRSSQPGRARTTVEPDFLATRIWPSLREIAELAQPEWDRLTQGSPVRRAGLEGLRRNALINLENEESAHGDPAPDGGAERPEPGL
ncbi:MAG: tRNA epoxyqueuosine(34) reductase QueG [Armatimonadetes bacterium]|nr:tRNA epoxyqueuosine(34) reductase QueG [Armatimonadota bacterium]